MPTDHVAQCHISAVLKHLQRWWSHHLSGQAISCTAAPEKASWCFQSLALLMKVTCCSYAAHMVVPRIPSSVWALQGSTCLISKGIHFNFVKCHWSAWSILIFLGHLTTTVTQAPACSTALAMRVNVELLSEREGMLGLIQFSFSSLLMPLKQQRKSSLIHKPMCSSRSSSLLVHLSHQNCMGKTRQTARGASCSWPWSSTCVADGWQLY